jgi:hypothetical protein
MMSAMKRIMGCALGLFTLLGGLQPAAKAQIAYVPEIGLIPTGATLTVTPVVSADRRYVRLGVDAFFNDLNFFSTFSFPGGAVGGGNFGGGGFGGIAAGMNGVIGENGYESGTLVGNGTNAQPAGAQGGMMRAGPLPNGAFGLGDPLLNAAGNQQAGDPGLMAGFEGDEAMAQAMAMEFNLGRNVRAAGAGSARSPRRSVRRKSTTKPTARRQSSTTASRTSR